jgi:tetratricopeptide (TPR) repeat protein/transcriptional regulator with XRE-family HTH domain
MPRFAITRQSYRPTLPDQAAHGSLLTDRLAPPSCLGLRFEHRQHRLLACGLRKAASVTEQHPASFAELLRQLRVGAGMTQEQLAESATVSSRSVSDLERGINLTPRRETARLLADALGLTGAARTEFEAAARRRAPAGTAARVRTPRPDAGVAAATRTLPRDVASFTGREPELERLFGASSERLGSGNAVTICAVGGMAGIGKTALAVHAAHLLAPRFPDGHIFLPRHGHTPGQAPIEPEQALASLLQSAGVAVEHVPQGLETRVRLWRDYLAGRRFLIVLDDAVGHDQVRPLLPGTAGSLVLITSRRHLTALEDAQAISLDVLPPAETAELLVKLAARSDVRVADPAVAKITRMCGCLPLAVGMLARQLHHHPAWTVTGLAANLAAAKDRIALMHAENLSVAAAFDLSYHELDPAPRRLFRRLGLHPGTDFDAYAAAALDDSDLDVTRRQLDELYDHYLVDEPAPGRYFIHDLLGEHARALSAADPASDRHTAVDRLLGYYLHTAGIASRHLPRRTPAGVALAKAPPPAHAPDLSTDHEAVRWLDAERVNLYAVTMYATGGRPGYAIAIPSVMHGYLRHQGRWDQVVTLHDAAIQTARRTGDRHAEANALTDLGDIQLRSSDYTAAMGSLTQAADLHRERGNSQGEANALAILGHAEHLAGHDIAAAEHLTSALGLHRADSDQLGEAGILNVLGMIQLAAGDRKAAMMSLTKGLKLHREIGNRLGEAGVLHSLGTLQHLTGDHAAAAASLTRSLELHRMIGNRLGEAQVLNAAGELALAYRTPAEARSRHEEALRIANAIASEPEEAQALEGIGRCQLQAGETANARGSLSEALAMYQRIGSPHAARVSALLHDPDG